MKVLSRPTYATFNESSEKQILDRSFSSLNSIKRSLVILQEQREKGIEEDAATKVELFENILKLELNLRRVQSCIRHSYQYGIQHNEEKTSSV